jgi:hypothetical protein
MATVRNIPLDQPPFPKFVLLDDGSGNLWWIDKDGDLLIWDEDELPDDDHEIRLTTVKLSDTDDNDEIQQAFALSTPAPGWESTRDEKADLARVIDEEDRRSLDHDHSMNG